MNLVIELSGNDRTALVYQTESGWTVAKQLADQTVGIFRYRNEPAAINCAMQIINLEL